MPKTITIPYTLLEKISNATDAFYELEDELEDFLLSKDPKFLAKMHRARVNHLLGKTKSLSDLKKIENIHSN